MSETSKEREARLPALSACNAWLSGVRSGIVHVAFRKLREHDARPRNDESGVGMGVVYSNVLVRRNARETCQQCANSIVERGGIFQKALLVADTPLLVGID